MRWLLLAGLCAGCGRFFTHDESAWIRESITREAHAAGMKLASPVCKQVPDRRAGTCESTATAAEVAGGAAYLGYVKAPSTSAFREGCGALPRWRPDAGTTELYILAPATKPRPETRIKAMWFDPPSGALCFDMTWSVG